MLYCAIDNECIKLKCDNEILISENVFDLYGSHDEADTRLAFHARHADKYNSGNIVVRANDTAVLVIFLVNAAYFVNSQVRMDFGQVHDNSRCYIDITYGCTMVENLRSIPGLYSFNWMRLFSCVL